MAIPTLLRPWVARLLGFAALATLGALEWRRMVEGVSVARALLWVAVALAAAVAVRLSAGVRGRWGGWAPLGVALLALAAAFAVAPLDLGLLRPARWTELGEGLSGGAEALGTVRLPYEGVDPWPGLVLGLLGSTLCVLAGLLAFWPRMRPGAGYPFFALVALLTLVITPVISLGGTRPLLLGVATAGLIVCFLWLERLPLRPGFGVAVLLAFAVAGGVPLATTADREEPWFDYKAFAEGLGSDPAQRFEFDRSEYGPITWPREGGEVLRVHTEKPNYLRVQVLDRFDGWGWVTGGTIQRGEPALLADELGTRWRARDDWTRRIEISVRGLRDTRIPAPGTVLDVAGLGRPVRPGSGAQPWEVERELRNREDYVVTSYVPQPPAVELVAAEAADPGARRNALWIEVPFIDRAPRGVPRTILGSRPRSAEVSFAPFGQDVPPSSYYPELQQPVQTDGDAALRASGYARTWALAQRLRSQAETPYEFVLAVDRHLEQGFRYTENPPDPAPGVPPLESFIHDTRAGYCQHFAGAMALMLRMGGLPARVASGFSPGGFSERKDAWVVRDTDAHAWVEVWFADWGWVTFDPTPPATPARSQTAAVLGAGTTPEDEDVGDAGVSRAPRESGPGAGDGGESATGGDAAAADAGAGVPWWAAVGTALAVAALAAWTLLRRRERRRESAGDPGALDGAVAELERALRRAGRPLPARATLQQIERGFGGGAREYVGALRRARFAAGALPSRVAGRRALRRELAAGRGLRGRVRALWALPPRP